MRLLVTGATGFLGRRFAVAARRSGHEVIAVTRRRSSFLDQFGFETVVKDLMALEASDIPLRLDGLVHFATGTDADDERVLAVAVEGTRRLLELAQATDVSRFVHVSSMSVYPGPVRTDSRRVDGLALEPHPERRGIYARSKTVAESALQDYARTRGLGGLELVILRPGLVFGAGMKSVLAGTAIELPLGLRAGLGRPTQTVPFVEVGDLVDGVLGLLDRTPEPGALHIYNVLSADSPTKSELLRLYNDLGGREGRTIWAPQSAALIVAALIDKLRSTDLTYNVRRMYRFEPADLPHEAFWRVVGMKPRGSARSAVTDALTIGRSRKEQGQSERVRCVAGNLCRIAAGSAPPLPEPVPLVLVGAGRIVSEMHVPALQALPQFKVRAVVDPDRRLVERTAEQFQGAAAFKGIRDVPDEILSGAAAVLATPGFLHGTLGKELLERGVSLLLEKPAALRREEFDELRRLENDHGRPVTIFHNYRLRPRVLDLWRFLFRHDVGRLVKASLIFHSPRIDLERARWMHEEKRNRVLLMELAIHFVDLVCLVGGRITGLQHVAVADGSDGRSTISVSGVARMERCDELFFDFDLSGTAPRTRLTLQFDRASCVVDFFPDGFRVLPRKGNPLDDLASDARRLTGSVARLLKPYENGLAKRALPHYRIYIEHLRRLVGEESASPFSPAGVSETMESLFLLADSTYPESAPAGSAN